MPVWQRATGAVLAAAAAISASAVFASPPIAGADTGTQSVLTIGNSDGFGSSGLNPAVINRGDFLDLAMQPLIQVKASTSAKVTYAPGLATSWHYVGKGHRTFVFTLRHNARFSDGTPVTAQAVKTWLDYFESSNSSHLSDLGPMKVTTVGAWTVRLDFATPNSAVVFALSGFVDNATAGLVEAPSCVANPASMSTATCGAGEYMLDPSQTVAGSVYTFVPNPYYYDKAQVHWSKVVIKDIAQPSSILQAMGAGQIQVATGDPTTVPAAKAAGFRIMASRNQQDYMALDVGGKESKPLADVRVRQALNYAIDRNAIVKSIFAGYGTPSSQFGTPDGNDPKYTNYYTYNPKKAKALLAAAGYPDGFTIPSASVMNTSYFPELEGAVAKYWAAIGVELSFTPQPPAVWFAGLTSNPSAVMTAGTAVFRPMFTAYGLFVAPGSIVNQIQGGWHDPVIAKDYKLLTDGVAGAAKKISDRLTTQADFVFLTAHDQYYYITKSIKGVIFPTGANATSLSGS